MGYDQNGEADAVKIPAKDNFDRAIFICSRIAPNVHVCDIRLKVNV